MLSYNKLNNITGWIVFAIATLVYVLTLEPTASFWDCGEFIAASYKLQVPHPPGAPLFLLIGRLFSLFASDTQHVAYMVNLVSALSSSFTILFLFWTITIIAKKIVAPIGTPSGGNVIAILGSGIVGSLAFTFSDSFWFSAEEAEVYAMSSFFTAFVFWAILKWEAHADEEGSDRWLLLIAYMMGLSIGVHLLNLVAIPALGYIYYFRKYKITTKGLVATMLISMVIIVIILWGIIPGLPSIAGKFEVFFINNLGLPFGSGILFFSVLLIGSIIYGIHYSIKHQKRILNTSLLALVFILIGYASYGIIVIRSNFAPPLNENDPENIISFVSYLKREQYGDRPLLKGPIYTAGYPIDFKKGEPLYRKGKDQYEIYDYKTEYEYDPKHIMLFPRIYSTQPHHIEAYKQWLSLKPNQKPTFFGSNIPFFISYQINHMYIRYFMWNFAGRESDKQDADWLKPGEWFKKVPYDIQNNKGRNNFYMIPFLLGLFGIIFHFSRNKKEASVITLLFFFTGIAIIIYLNQPPQEPRERDYTYTGSFYAFCIWIGIGVIALADALQKIIKSQLARPVIATILGLVAPVAMAVAGWDDHNRSHRYHSVDSAKNLLNSCAPNAVLFTGGDNDTFPLWYVQEVEGFRTDVRVCNLSLLNTDWYIDQMKKQSYNSAPLPITLQPKDYLQGKNDQLYFVEKPEIKGAINLEMYLKLVEQDDPFIRQETRGGDYVTIYPSKSFFLNIDKSKVEAAGIVPEKYKQFITDRLVWTINQGAMEKKDLVMLDIIANGEWKRPIYFSTTLAPSNFLNLRAHMQLEGLAYRLLPVTIPGATQGWIETDTMYNKMLHHYYWRGLDDPRNYYDENYLRFPINARFQFSRLADQLINEGKNDKAKEVIDYCFKVMPDNSVPYDGAIPTFIPLYLKLGEKKKALEITNIMGKRALEDEEYYLEEKDLNEVRMNLSVLQQLYMSLREAKLDKESAKYEEAFMKYYEQMRVRFKLKAEDE